MQTPSEGDSAEESSPPGRVPPPATRVDCRESREHSVKGAFHNAESTERLLETLFERRGGV